jgi:hypothetical protein
MSFMVFLVFVTIILVTGLKVASEGERFLIYRLGRYLGLKGPGLCFAVVAMDKCVKICKEDRGELLSSGWARINGVEVPVQVGSSAEIGQRVRVTGFTKDYVIVVGDSNSKR